MAKDRDSSDASTTSQSKRPGLSRFNSEPEHQHRLRAQKHVVGGGTTGRHHARVPSSKGLHKHHATASLTAKLTRRQTSLSPETVGPQLPLATNHRRATSDVKLPQDFSVTNLGKNTSHTNLKRNKSHVEVKKNKSSTNIKRSSNLHVGKCKSKVHFNLGEDGPDDEWVDASGSASPHLSRRGSTVSGVSGDHVGSTTTSSAPKFELLDQSERNFAPPAVEPVHCQPKASEADQETANHSRYLTTRILQRTSSYGAPPKISMENIQARPPSRGSSAGTPGVLSQIRPGSSGGPEGLTSRFLASHSQGSGLDDFFAIRSNQEELARFTVAQPSKPPSEGSNVTDDEADKRMKSTPLQTRPGNYMPSRDMSRTQQKLNLQRAFSSTLDITRGRPHSADRSMLDCPLPASTVEFKSATPYDLFESKQAKMLDQADLEYNFVRRYQNPIAHSMVRLQHFLGQDKTRRIPQSGASHSKKSSDVSGELNVASLIGSQAVRSSDPPRRSTSTSRLTAAFTTGLDTDFDRVLSGTRLGEDGSDSGTLALLRILWDKNLDLSASQE